MLRKLYRVAKSLQFKAFLLSLRARNLLSRKSLLSNDGPIVSLTSYGSRLDTVFLTLETIGKGNCLPSRLILWLDDTGDKNTIPSSISRLKRRGLEVYFGENLKPHNKYYHYLQLVDHFDLPLVTADDDILYPDYWLKDLYHAYQARPDLINCFRARNIKLDKGKIAPYSTWQTCTNTKESFLNLATGVSGVIYPPKYLEFLKRAGKEFVNCCPRADDLWLHVNAIRSRFKIKQIYPASIHFPMIPNSQETALMHNNLKSGNDEQIAKTYGLEDIKLLVEAQNNSSAGYV